LKRRRMTTRITIQRRTFFTVVLKRSPFPAIYGAGAAAVQPRTTLIGPVACAKGDSPGVLTFAMNGKFPPSPAHSMP
jgi:hypothetical protein